MTRLALAAALLLAASPAFAQTWTGTVTPYGGSIYGGPPTGYSVQLQQQPRDNSYASQVLEQANRYQACRLSGSPFC